MRTSLALAASLSLSFALAAQGSPSVLQLNSSYHYGELSVQITNPSSHPALTRALLAGRGDVNFKSDFTFNSKLTLREILQNPANSKTTTEFESGTYEVRPDSRMIFDFNPSQPGTDILRMFSNPDASVILGIRETQDIESSFIIMTPKSSGQSTASLKGQYALVSNFVSFDNNGGMKAGTSKGIMTMDGVGSAVYSGSEQNINANGSSSISAVGGNGQYSVAADGTFSFGPTEIGGISPNGDFFFFTSQDPNESALTIAIKIGPQHTANQVAGNWAMAYHEVTLGSQASLPSVYTESGFMDLKSTNSTTGTFSGETTEITSTPQGITQGQSTLNGQYDLGPSGGVRLNPSSPTPVNLSYSDSAELILGANFNGRAELFMATRICGGSKRYGKATKGTGNIAPVSSMRTFPALGNQNFQLTLTDGVGGGAGVMVLTFGPLPAIPFLGGSLHVDTSLLLISVGTSLSGQAGSAGDGEASLALPLPNNPNLAGLNLYVQSVIIDAGGPAGFAMSSGLKIQLCR